MGWNLQEPPGIRVRSQVPRFPGPVLSNKLRVEHRGIHIDLSLGAVEKICLKSMGFGQGKFHVFAKKNCHQHLMKPLSLPRKALRLSFLVMKLVNGKKAFSPARDHLAPEVKHTLTYWPISRIMKLCPKRWESKLPSFGQASIFPSFWKFLRLLQWWWWKWHHHLLGGYKNIWLTPT